MAKLAKFLQGVAGAAGGAALNVEDVFSTYLYTGNGSTQTITNGIDLAGEGGLVWTKSRTEKVYTGYDHTLFDTERGIDKRISTNTTAAQVSGMTFSATSTGFTDGYNTVSTEDMVSWTFRKAPKFFDVVTYTGNGVAGRTVSHNLGSVPGCMIVKRTDTTGNWHVYHRGIDVNGDSAPETDQIYLNLTNAASDGIGYWNDTAPTSTEFTVGSNSGVNALGGTYVAYLFAHNDGDGDFGDGTQDIIKCGNYTGGGTTNVSIDLGFEPQWVMIKAAAGTTGDWAMFDNMRGIVTGGTDNLLRANTTAAEYTSVDYIDVTSTGFKTIANNNYTNGSGSTYIYIAIRRGPMAVPESATDVFTPLVGLTSADAPPLYQATHTIDMVIDHLRLGDSAFIIDRLRGNKLLKASGTDAESGNATYTWDYQTGAFNRSAGATTWYIGQCFRRAPSFFDVVAYTGNGVAGRTVSHNLGVAPEMMWVKFRSGGTSNANWIVYHANTPVTRAQILLNLSNAASADNVYNWNNTSPTATEFTLGAGGQVNANNDKYIAYLFASLDGISKVGSYTGNGSTQTIDCGFSSGARFVLIKRTDSTGDWYVWDTERGIVAANDPHLSLNTTAAEVTTDDSVDPVSSGFAVNQVAATNINVSSATYIFYAIA